MIKIHNMVKVMYEHAHMCSKNEDIRIHILKIRLRDTMTN